MSIDSRAVVDPAARVDPSASVGPFSVIGPEVEIGAETWIGPHVVIQGPTRIGRENRIFQFCSIGEVPQDKKFSGEQTWVEIGDRNTIREFATINRGTEQGGGLTRIGDDNWLMAYIHIAHDCLVGNHTIFANGSSLAGHVSVEDYAILGGFSLVHQFCRIGAYSFTAMGSGINKDVAPFLMVAGNPARSRGLNSEGLRRHGFGAERIRAIREAYRAVFRGRQPLDEALAEIAPLAAAQPDVQRMADFIGASQRSIIR